MQTTGSRAIIIVVINIGNLSLSVSSLLFSPFL
jgi:hypothetical protein